MFALALFLAGSFELHDPDEHATQLNNFHGGLLCLAIAVVFMLWRPNTWKSVDLTRWLRYNYDERPASDFERIVVILLLLAGGAYLLTHP